MMRAGTAKLTQRGWTLAVRPRLLPALLAFADTNKTRKTAVDKDNWDGFDHKKQ
jgi:hypothetical protein